jgi:hypothetical protein
MELCSRRSARLPALSAHSALSATISRGSNWGQAFGYRLNHALTKGLTPFRQNLNSNAAKIALSPFFTVDDGGLVL